MFALPTISLLFKYVEYYCLIFVSVTLENEDVAKQIECKFLNEIEEKKYLSYVILHKPDIIDILAYLVERETSFKVMFNGK